MSKPGCIDNCEEAILNSKFLPEYMKGSRYFRIEYREPKTGFSNCEGSIYLPSTSTMFDTLDKICKLIEEEYNKLEEEIELIK